MTKTLRTWNPATVIVMAAAGPLLAETTVPDLNEFAKLPLAFEANQGQADSRIMFMAHGLAYSVFLTRQEAVLNLTGPAGQTNVLYMALSSANPNPTVSGQERLPGESNYLIGNDRSKWHTGVPSFGRVRYEAVYPGIDLIYYGNRGQLEYDFVAAPGADPARIRMRFAGARGMRVAPDGDLVMKAGAEEIRFQHPTVYQTLAGGGRSEVRGRFVLRAPNEAGFRLSAYDHSLPLVIDPAIVRSTYLGGKGKDIGYAIAVDRQGSVYVTGSTNSASGFPLISCFHCALAGAMDAFVTKFHPSGGGYFYSTYLGGSGSDAGFGIAADGQGNAYITGETNSPNFPLAGPALPPGGGVWDAFVTALNPAGFPIYSTYLGGSGTDVGYGIAVDGGGNAVVVGATNSPNLPVVTCLQCFPQGATDAFVTGFNPVGLLRFSTYFGGKGNDFGYGISLDANDEIGITGSTTSVNFPVVACAQCINHGGRDIFASTLIYSSGGPSLSLKWSTYWGGGKDDVGYGIAMDSPGEAWVAGFTTSINFPITATCIQCVNGGGQDAVVVRFNVTSATFSDYLGGAGDDTGRAIVEATPATGGLPVAYIAGDTFSLNFPLLSCIAGFGCAPNGGDDVFVAAYAYPGVRLFSTYLGGKADDVGRGIAVGPYGEYVTGSTASNPYPIVAPCTQCTYRGGASDAFVTVIR